MHSYLFRYDLGEWPAEAASKAVQAIGFGPRSAEVIVAANLMWPAQEPEGDDDEPFDVSMPI